MILDELKAASSGLISPSLRTSSLVVYYIDSRGFMSPYCAKPDSIKLVIDAANIADTANAAGAANITVMQIQGTESTRSTVYRSCGNVVKGIGVSKSIQLGRTEGYPYSTSLGLPGTRRSRYWPKMLVISSSQIPLS